MTEPALEGAPRRRTLHPLDEFRRIWKEQMIWNLRERAVLSVLIVLADNMTGRVNARGAGAPKRRRYGQTELARMAGISKSSLIRALEVLCDPQKAGVVARFKTKTSDGVNEINVYQLLPDKLAQWADHDRPSQWNPPTKTTRGSVSMRSPPSVAVPAPAVGAASCHDVAILPVEPEPAPPPSAPEPAPPPPPAQPPPPPARQTVAELAATVGEMAAKRGDDLLAVLNRQAAAGHPWCIKVAERFCENGYRLSDAERKRLREIRDEEAHAAPRRPKANSRTGTTARQAPGTYRPGGRHGGTR